jgi:zinc protease
VIELMRQQMERIRLEPVSDAELDLAKQSLINSFVFAFNNTHSIVSRKVRLEYYDYPPDYLESYRDKIAAVTVADVQRVARTYLHPDRLQIVLVGDSSKYLDAINSFGMPVEKVEL